ncbi:ABC transporter [Dyella solisilvae]|uniref:ABC transporter n=1 Tax=Dyella solisilvae TaxID=1920168 RepID=A0A370K837_9GAMM|nr:GldG family protein [Dyella solisilvae]RDI98822.1 ABC transporter [Dyella solisilvae]
MVRLFRRLNGWLVALLLLACAGAIGYFAARYDRVADWTYEGRATLSSESRAVLAALDGPVEIVSYANPQDDLRNTIASFIQRYQRLKPDLTLRFVDPQQDPAQMRELGITVDGTLILHYRGREQRLSELSERSLTNAFERLLRGSDRIVAFVTGDGERSPSDQGNADLGTFIAQMEGRGMRAVPLNFAQATAVPLHTDLVVLASPQRALPEGAVQALTTYVANGGNLLWLTDPGNEDLHLQPLADALGIHVLPGVLVDGQGAALGLNDPRLIALGDYPKHAITHGFNLTTQFPQVSALALAARTDWRVSPFLRSGVQSWTEFKPIDNAHASTIAYDASAGELKGPLDFGLALARLSPSPDKAEQRVVVVGDGDFLSNAFLGSAGNRALGERIFDWLLGDDVLVNLPPSHGAPDRVLRISQAQLSAVSLGFLIVLPLLLFALGGWITWRRRRA